MEIFIKFLDTWQTLIGAALGPFLAVILSAVGFWIKSIVENKRERKEFLRRIEVGITRSLDDTYKTRQKLLYFVSRLKNLVAEIRAVTDPRQFSLESINYPTVREIYRDIEAPNFKVKSYYLHNKLLWADAGIKETNETVVSLKNDFAELQRKNELHIILMRQNANPNPAQQRVEYSANLELFANAIDDFIARFMKQGIEIMTQIKIYNEHLRRKHSHWFLWKYEGTKFKYFYNKAEQKQFSRNLDSLERIDMVIRTEVEAAIKEAEARAEKLSQDRN
ncbi:hypothetical protein A3B21_04270 [Candidatus Uhrbacteria bacterium RIFCSPLOWO2_01_FULL_47_24]|uniref:Uncharacterized protein n=1 Tax=Candidatus Uhrbacteria bacterium RIFCSPLOWO2_01_FULL_47_24 TaxID=1802401 RepID=A0A1F7UV40_9BACT|nr:MAG: hypothetical protein A3G16_05270 [Candidatus Curtissbacteria bacterium RIFCSPLOWO2_12_FULL_41_16]OGL68799.1 MAG: hypothetical protein A3D58_01475 [Candidatus Uhrbacteria bacterium RIFCSPHIGHO2_02_FULL_46_47]OGL81604.1 MAG: hypothetical protein A3B21_04270 [Candidatus Uhrbacteria bacterium RIFCSPLOWO2_01_FULL_47_24]OGL83986.1 MAG: hypothetical protein A3J03_01035 [Candidatus Uhrbacteria bacterium RIFCSPLOWO2_02_FULL_46_25]